jgi:hypothetical protein
MQTARHAVDSALTTGGIGDVEHSLIKSAKRETSDLINGAQYVELSTSASQMRSALVECKTHADFAEAYVRKALGYEDGD